MRGTRGNKLLTTSLSLGLAALGVGCGVDENVYNAAVKDRDAKAAELTKTKADLEAEKVAHQKESDRSAMLAKKLTSLGQDVSRLETERSGLGGELEQANKRMEELKKAQAQAEARAAQFRKLVTQFKSLTDAGKLKVEIRENRMIIALGDKILFDPGKTDLKPEGKEALTQVTAVLKDLPNRNFQVAGHTDNIPIKSAKFRSNWDLSTARAVEVVNYMITAGLESKRLSAAGYAAESPVAPNDTAENKAKNRRIEITLVPNLDDLPPIDDALKDQAPGAATAGTPGKS
jgi:chemotaxis protein MotB